MTTTEIILNLLTEITGTALDSKDLATDLFEEGLLDSLASVQLLVELENQCGLSVPISEFDRSQWGTPQQIIDQVDALQA